MDAFGTRLRKARERAKLTPLELATKAGVREGDIHRWERTPEMDVRASTVRAVAVALGESADYLLGLASDPTAAAAPKTAQPSIAHVSPANRAAAQRALARGSGGAARQAPRRPRMTPPGDGHD